MRRYYFALAQAGLFIFLIISYAIVPAFAQGSGGISNYGTDPRTVVPFTIAFVLAAVFTYLAAQSIPSNNIFQKKFRLLLKLLAFIYLALLISTYPYQLTPQLDLIHKFIGLSLLALQAYICIFVSRNFKKEIVIYTFLGLFILGSVIIFLSLFTPLGWLAVGQVLGSTGFAGVGLRVFGLMRGV